MFSVFMAVYIPLQLRSEKEKQTPVIETSPPISMVPVRTRRSVPVCVCACVCVFGHMAVPQLIFRNASSTCMSLEPSFREYFLPLT